MQLDVELWGRGGEWGGFHSVWNLAQILHS